MTGPWPILIAAAISPLCGPAFAGPATSVSLDAGVPATICLETTLPVDSPRRRPVLVIYALSGAGLAVAADNGEKTRIGLFPGNGFDNADGSDVQRHFLPGAPSTRCWTVAVDDGQTARVGLELSQPLE